MTRILQLQPSLGNVLKNEYDPCSGYCRKAETVTRTATMKVGSLLIKVSNKWVEVDTTTNPPTSSSELAILIDDEVYEVANGDQTLAVLFRGPSQVREGGVDYNDLDSTEIATANANLEAAGIDVLKYLASDQF